MIEQEEDKLHNLLQEQKKIEQVLGGGLVAQMGNDYQVENFDRSDPMQQQWRSRTSLEQQRKHNFQPKNRTNERMPNVNTPGGAELTFEQNEINRKLLQSVTSRLYTDTQRRQEDKTRRVNDVITKESDPVSYRP